MISLNELMIGNYLHGNQKKDFGVVNEIKAIGIIEIKLKSGCSDLYSENELNAIPLTEEWLLKFGFEKVNKKFVSKKNGFTIEYKYYKFWEEMTDVAIVSVHQLQNLYFAITGEELGFYSSALDKK